MNKAILVVCHCFFVLRGCAPLNSIRVRCFIETDATQVAQLFHDTVRTINALDYSQPQLKAWAPDNVEFRDWVGLGVNSTRYTVVAEDSEKLLLGFAELEHDGHIDCFYCHKDYQRRGIGRLLYREVEKQAMAQANIRIVVDASITSRPFFEAMGFTVVQEQTVLCREQFFKNFRMEKSLDRSSK
jgi:putative acetyltransferase